MNGLNGKLLPKSFLNAIIASSILLLFYFTVVSLISGWNFAQAQFLRFWYFIITLDLGFGTQVGLFTYLKKSTHNRNTSGKVLATSGTTSTVAMISCCSHYLANVLPFLGVAGAITIISQYQIQLFWLGLAFNFLGILYLLNKVMSLTRRL